jgi:hypothetical protein
MTTRINISLPQHLAEAVAERDSPSWGGRSGIIARALDRYAEVCRRHIPDLSVPEWTLIMDSLRGTIHEPAAMISVLEHGIADSLHLDKLDAKHGVNGEALLAKLRKLGYAERVAICDVAERYWAAVARGEDGLVPGESTERGAQ